MQVHAHHIQQLRHELRVAREFERLLPVRLQAVLCEMRHTVLASTPWAWPSPECSSASAQAVCCSAWPSQCVRPGPAGVCVRVLRPPPTSSAPPRRRSAPATVDRCADLIQALRNCHVGVPRSAKQSAALHHLLRRAMRPNPSLQQFLLLGSQLQSGYPLPAHPPRRPQGEPNV